MAEAFYKVIFDGALTGANPLRLRKQDFGDLKVGDTIPVVSRFESFESDPRRRIGEIIGSIDDFAMLGAEKQKAAIEHLGRHRPPHALGEIVRIEADSERGCVGLLVVREVPRA